MVKIALKIPLLLQEKSPLAVADQNFLTQDDCSVHGSAIKTKIKPTLKPSCSGTTLISQINRIFWITLGCWSTYNLIDIGLSHLLVLETLTHGTGPLGYIGISLTGGDPNYGGGKTGSSAGANNLKYMINSKNYFYLFKDSGFIREFLPTGVLSKLLCHGIKALFPRIHALLSGVASFEHSSHMTAKIGEVTLGAMIGLLTPTLKFRFIPSVVVCSNPCLSESNFMPGKIIKKLFIGDCHNPCFFEDDPDYGGIALRTSKPISLAHLGVTGSVFQGINSNVFNRMHSYPESVFLGVVLLGVAILVAKKTYSYAKSPYISQILSKPHLNLNSAESASHFWEFKRGIKKIGIKSCWLTVALTIIFFNTL